jgi:hypothetical protein
MIDRQDVLAHDRARKLARDKLIQDAKQTRENVRPGNMLGRWKARQTERLEKTTADALSLAQKNKGLLGGLAVGAIIIAARRPLIAVAKKLNDKFRKS